MSNLNDFIGFSPVSYYECNSPYESNGDYVDIVGVTDGSSEYSISAEYHLTNVFDQTVNINAVTNNLVTIFFDNPSDTTNAPAPSDSFWWASNTSQIMESIAKSINVKVSSKKSSSDTYSELFTFSAADDFSVIPGSGSAVPGVSNIGSQSTNDDFRFRMNFSNVDSSGNPNFNGNDYYPRAYSTDYHFWILNGSFSVVRLGPEIFSIRTNHRYFKVETILDNTTYDQIFSELWTAGLAGIRLHNIDALDFSSGRA